MIEKTNISCTKIINLNDITGNREIVVAVEGPLPPGSKK